MSRAINVGIGGKGIIDDIDDWVKGINTIMGTVLIKCGAKIKYKSGAINNMAIKQWKYTGGEN